MKRSATRNVTLKIRRKILEYMKPMCDEYDLQIIKENYFEKKPSFTRLGSGVRSVLDMVSQMVTHVHAGELQEAFLKDMKTRK